MKHGSSSSSQSRMVSFLDTVAFSFLAIFFLVKNLSQPA